MREKLERIILSLMVAVLIGSFVSFFGLPSTMLLRSIGAVYVLGLLLLVLFKPPEILRISKQIVNIYICSHLILFLINYLILRLSLNLDSDTFYSIVLLMFYTSAGIITCLSQNIPVKGTGSQNIGHASSAVCFKEEQKRLYTYLIFNNNHDLWLLPGGHLDISHDEPYMVAKHRILSELGYESTALEAVDFEMKRFESIEVLNGCHAFYRITMLPDKCHHVHFDFGYVCVLEKQIAKPKYENIRFDISGCNSPEAINASLREAVNNYYREKHIAIPSVTYPSDIPDRIYSGLLFYHSRVQQTPA